MHKLDQAPCEDFFYFSIRPVRHGLSRRRNNIVLGIWDSNEAKLVILTMIDMFIFVSPQFVPMYGDLTQTMMFCRALV